MNQVQKHTINLKAIPPSKTLLCSCLIPVRHKRRQGGPEGPFPPKFLLTFLIKRMRAWVSLARSIFLLRGFEFQTFSYHILVLDTAFFLDTAVYLQAKKLRMHDWIVFSRQRGSTTFDLRAILQKRDNLRATSSKMMCTTCSQDLKLKREDKSVRHWNCHTIANSNFLQISMNACGRDFSDILPVLVVAVGDYNVQCFVCHSILDFTWMLV